MAIDIDIDIAALSIEQLTELAALTFGAGDAAGFDPWALFLEEACVMEKWGKAYRVSVKIPGGLYGIPAFSTASAFDPLEACMRAFLKSRAVR